MTLTAHKAVTIGAGKSTFGIVDTTAAEAAASDSITTKAYVDKKPIYLTGIITDISTAASHFVVSPIAGTIDKIYSTIDNAITVANAALSFEIAGTAVTSGGITVATASSAAGDVDSATPSAENAVTAGQAIEMITDGGSTTACRATITFVITPS